MRRRPVFALVAIAAAGTALAGASAASAQVPRVVTALTIAGNGPFDIRQGGKLTGFEINIQQPFNFLPGWGKNFGVLANYTVVNGDVGYDDGGDPGIDQFALTGLSDTANAMLMYEKYGWSVRLAWNWRDEYLILANQGASRNPYYVEEYEQWDLSVNYTLNDHWSFGLEAINLTGEDVRWRARTDQMIVKLADQSPRYMDGVRYKF